MANSRVTEIPKTSFRGSWPYILGAYDNLPEEERKRTFTIAGQLEGGSANKNGKVEGVSLTVMCIGISNNSGTLSNMQGVLSIPSNEEACSTEPNAEEQNRVRKFVRDLMKKYIPSDLMEQRDEIEDAVTKQIFDSAWPEHHKKLCATVKLRKVKV